MFKDVIGVKNDNGKRMVWFFDVEILNMVLWVVLYVVSFVFFLSVLVK